MSIVENNITRPIIFLGASSNLDNFVHVANLVNKNIAGIIDDNFFGNTENKCGIPVIGSEESWNFDLFREEFDYFIGASMVPINQADRAKRIKMIDIAEKYHLSLATLIHPRSEIYPGASIGSGSYVGFCASISNRVVIGQHCQIHSYVGITHDCQVGNNTSIANQVMIAGNTTIGSHVHIGMGATLCKSNGITVGDHAVIHPRITVMRNVEQNETVHMAGNNTRRIFKEVIRS
jgi:acetyltransferase-like isoleucine patch superfamily enzyme